MDGRLFVDFILRTAPEPELDEVLMSDTLCIGVGGSPMLAAAGKMCVVDSDCS